MAKKPGEEHTPEPQEEYHDPEEMGPLGEPATEETPKGIFILLTFFLIALVVMWFLVYYQLWLRG